ncbi:Sec63 [Serendipita sp. 397]|nr:Sec63 [Serendipita sp. 397]
MKMRAKSRFILVSATVPNASDIATWIGPRDGGESAICLKFGNEYRPCKLTQHVQGYRRNNASSFQFDRTLDGKVFGALQKYCDAKPTLIFCATRKGAVTTAQRIVKDYKEMQTKHAVLPWKPIKQEWPKMHSDLVELVSFGVAIHHAGLSPEDRRLIEDRFLTGKLFIVVATSTLAKVERAHEKVYILLQAILGNISLGATEYQNRDSILPLEATRVYKHAIRLMSCVIEAAVSRGAGSLLKTSLELYRSLKAKGWEDRPTVLRQLEGIGEKAMQAWLEFISRDFLSSH